MSGGNVRVERVYVTHTLESVRRLGETRSKERRILFLLCMVYIWGTSRSPLPTRKNFTKANKCTVTGEDEKENGRSKIKNQRCQEQRREDGNLHQKGS